MFPEVLDYFRIIRRKYGHSATRLNNLWKEASPKLIKEFQAGALAMLRFAWQKIFFIHARSVS